MKTLLFIFGTRPEVIKLSPIIKKFKEYPNEYKVIVCNTEQQKQLSNQTLDYFDFKADINLNAMSENQSLAEISSRLLLLLENVFKEKIDLTFVQGDTISAFSGALQSFYHKVPFCHVEAGLRSNNLFEPFPEEAFRQMISRLATFHFTPTLSNKRALLKENVAEENIHVVGNTVVDALKSLDVNTSTKIFDEIQLKDDVANSKLVLITIHRRENHGERLDVILKAIQYLTRSYPDHVFVLPVHPNPNVKLKINSTLKHYHNIHLMEALDYPHMVYLMQHAKLILTDSGGIQEEAPTFGCPVIVLRYKTERIEGVEAGVSELVGADFNKIVQTSKIILDKNFNESRLKTVNPYGDGKTCQRIFDIVSAYFNETLQKKDKF